MAVTTKKETVTMKPIKIDHVKVRIVGDTPLIVHAWSEKAKREMLEAWDENKIREGDKVHVKKGRTRDRYDTYYKWLKDNISNVDLLLGFERSDAISTADTYTVVKIAPHEFFGGTQLAFIKRTNGIGDTFSYLYDIDSLEKVTEG